MIHGTTKDNRHGQATKVPNSFVIDNKEMVVSDRIYHKHVSIYQTLQEKKRQAQVPNSR